ncbi:response regulator transcription factor [Nissabacter sp. SGAir0207]|uniref:response regulator transcription factor n=1 Tax=Nissabacter sp. SGAir0207 TaxID=2126321 RepID=UPI0010CCE839|nr:response regulator [Nissabacter sp. SGAir0207]QCR38217.1 response regulator [Nissabacter sp. SGAir0207]
MTPPCIAIVDDERSVRSGLSNLLQSDGYTTVTFDSAEALLSRADALSGVAVAIIDVTLKGMGGLALYQTLVSQGSPPPVIFISGHGDETMQRIAATLGALAFLHKPIDIDTLLAHIQRAATR